MAKQTFPLRLDAFTFEVKYAFGYTYLDRCGQVIVDAERNYDGWVPGSTSSLSGILENPGLAATVRFSADAFAFSATRVDDLSALAASAEDLWGVVRLNLGLSEWVRIGCRFQYLLPKSSLGEVERTLMRAPLRVALYDETGRTIDWPEGYAATKQQPSITLQREGVEYRVTLQSVTRIEGVSTSALVRTNPRLLPRNRRKAQLDAIKARQSYARDPTYALHLDIDCFVEDPTDARAREFILAQHECAKDLRFVVNGL